MNREIIFVLLLDNKKFKKKDM